jgi:hypothetical protein
MHYGIKIMQNIPDCYKDTLCNILYKKLERPESAKLCVHTALLCLHLELKNSKFIVFFIFALGKCTLCHFQKQNPFSIDMFNQY